MLEKQIVFYGFDLRDARDSAVLEGMLEPNASVRNVKMVYEEVDTDDVVGDFWPQIKGLTEEENYRTLSKIVIKQIENSPLLRSIIL